MGLFKILGHILFEEMVNSVFGSLLTDDIEGFNELQLKAQKSSEITRYNVLIISIIKLLPMS
jgi:hypothetical protein